MNEQNVVLITGMSGAGKTTAMGILEDMGYHCIDNFPVQLIASLGKIINTEPDPRYKNIALATTAMDYPKFLQYFDCFFRCQQWEVTIALQIYKTSSSHDHLS